MQTLILDSSQLSCHFECPTEWANRGLILINEKNPQETHRPGDKIAAGSLGHKYLEIYYHHLCKTAGDSGASAKAALAFDPDTEDKNDPQFPLDQKLRARVKDRVGQYFMFYPPDRDYTPSHKLKTVVVAQNGVLITKSIRDPLIEKGFSFPLYESKEYLFILEGRIDFVGRVSDGTLIWMDHKFQFSEHNLYPKDIQFKNYALATGLDLAVINYVRLHEKIGQFTFVRQPLSFSRLEMRYWKEELTDKYVEIAKQVAIGEFPQNWGSCKGGWGKPCQFTQLCEERNASLKDIIRKQKYTARKEWRPW